MTSRPRMHARDSSGRKVSLLNDEPARPDSAFQSTYPAFDPMNMVRTGSGMSTQSSSPHIPGLVRADSFDSSNANDPTSPVTPTSFREFGGPTSFMGYKAQPQYEYHSALPRVEDYSGHQFPRMSLPNQYSNPGNPYAESRMFEEDSYQSSRMPQERGAKRYPCRHRDSHGCDKTFTTSGHASRHSKIHTAEKGVVCTWKGCQKKFTRGDNMKQHLETHTKERTRASAIQKNTTTRTLTMPSGVRKASSALDSRSSRPSSRNANDSSEYPPVDPALYQQRPIFTSHGSPSAPSAYYGPPMTPRGETLPSGLDALASLAAGSHYRS
ncbi:hypothetical protein WAI453_008738 [Rhynchosporium graminicola]|uniref:C2H2 type master regulator of conidiophore development brlA n=1 Tax=Rhynchosporium graminicola TaxID=2792576 RepID=A0A1E1KHX8_9HELO|nr:uncharacterized protein RCO7_00138 [Rhynchosporium commune]